MGFIALIYGVVAYLVFFLLFIFLVFFVSGDMLISMIGMGFGKTIDSGGSSPTGQAALINIGLLMLFAVTHTGMARPGFKKIWTRIVPTSVERSTYVMVTNIVLIALFVHWVPMPGTVWEVTSPLWSTVLTLLFFAGAFIVLLSTFLINHFELFGLQQVWYRFRGKELPEPEFRTPLLYKHVRHPLYLGFILFFWSIPEMSVGHLLFAAVMTIYIFVAVGYEERDLVKTFGDKYLAYQAKVPSIFPIGKRKD